MDKRPFYKEQADKFRDYARKSQDRELLSLFNEWCDSKDIYGRDKHEIWKIARKIRPLKPLVIKENSEELVRIDAVLDILLQADLKYLNELIEKRKKEKENEEK
jgi:hypothetical protein